MKKLTTLFTTTMIALAFMMAAPSAMAKQPVPEWGDANFAQYACSFYTYPNAFWKNHGQCVKAFNIAFPRK
jgi:hypothetical protein